MRLIIAQRRASFEVSNCVQPVRKSSRWVRPLISATSIRPALFAWTLALTLGTPLSASADAGFWLDVPFVRQDKNLCGAASVSMVLQYWQKASPAGISLEVPSFPHIAEALRSTESKGVLGSQMKTYLSSLGYQVFVFK